MATHYRLKRNYLVGYSVVTEIILHSKNRQKKYKSSRTAIIKEWKDLVKSLNSYPKSSFS